MWRQATPDVHRPDEREPGRAPGYGTYNVCTGQCWYDIFVHTPKGHPDVVYVGGSYSYGETFGISNGRGVVLSTDAGVTSTDMTMDATDLHPPERAASGPARDLVTSPDDPFQFFEANDGGVMRSRRQVRGRVGLYVVHRAGSTRRHVDPLPAAPVAGPEEARGHQRRACRRFSSRASR